MMDWRLQWDALLCVLQTIVITLIRVKQYSAYMVFPQARCRPPRSPDSGRSDAGSPLPPTGRRGQEPFLVALGERVRELRARREG